MNAGSTARILVVEDDEELLRSIAKLLEIRGYSVLTALDGREGLDVFGRERPELVITDLMMPEKDGLEFIREAKQLQSDVRIICISGGGSWQLKNQLDVARLMGAAMTLEKPVTAEDLWTAVEEVLARE